MKRSARWLVLVTLTFGAPAVPAADPWAGALKKRGIDPALVENPIAITPEIKAAAEAFSGGEAEPSTS